MCDKANVEGQWKDWGKDIFEFVQFNSTGPDKVVIYGERANLHSLLYKGLVEVINISRVAERGSSQLQIPVYNER